MNEAQALRAEIDLEALRHNVRWVRAQGGERLMAVVKANAYGHGVEHVVPVLCEEAVEAFAVATVAEGAELRALGVTAPVLVFGAPLPGALGAYERHGLDVNVSSAAVAEAVLAHPGPLRVHVKVDTGLHRLGLGTEEALAVLRRLRAAAHVEVVAAWTHFATADEADPGFAREQLARFERAVAGLDVPMHLANSGALAQLPEAVRGRAFVRAGGLLYGLPTTPSVEALADVRPVMRLVSRVVHVQTLAPGEAVSYGCTWRAEAPTRIATVAAGYADGLPRSLSNRGRVGVGGRSYRIAGRVCMDMLMLDLGVPDGPGGAVAVGDEAVLFGPGGPSALEAATLAETIAYALPSGLTARVPRVARP